MFRSLSGIGAEGGGGAEGHRSSRGKRENWKGGRRRERREKVAPDVQRRTDLSFTFTIMEIRSGVTCRQWTNITRFVRIICKNIRQIIRTDIRLGNWPLFVL